MGDEIQDDSLSSMSDPGMAAETGLSAEELAAPPSSDGGLGDSGGLNTPAQGQGQAQRAQTIREAAAAYGLDLSGQPDDHAAFVHLVNQARQAQVAVQQAQANEYYTSLGRKVAPQARDFEGYLEKQRASQATAAKTPQAWESPEFDEGWLNLVERDEQTGVWKARPGINPEYAEKVQRYADWMQGFNKNPMAIINQAIQFHSAEVARKVYAEQHAQVERQGSVRSIVEQNAGWIYQSDEQGRRLTDARGQFVPTPEGARYVQHVASLAQSGVRDPKQQDQIARQLVQGEIAAAYYAQQAQAQQAQSPQARAAVGRPAVNPGQAVNPARRALVAAATEPSTEGKSLAELLREGMDAEGITDADFAPDRY